MSTSSLGSTGASLGSGFILGASTTGAGSGALNVSHSLFSTNSVEMVGFIYVGISNTLFDGATDNEWVYNPVLNVMVGHQLFGAAGDTTAEALYFPVAHTIFAGEASNQISPDAYEEITHYLGFTERFFQDVTQLLFRDADPGIVTVAQSVSVVNVLFSTYGQSIDRAYNAETSLGWGVEIAQIFDNSILERMGLSEDIDLTGNSWGRTVTQGGVLKQSIALTITGNDCREEQYAPLIGESGDDSYESIASTGPTLTDGDTLTLTYPYDSPTLTLVLENPDMGNTDTFNFTRIDRKTRGGDRKLLTLGKWATWERLEVEISGIECNATLQEIITFLNTSLGKEIGFADWEGRTWRGIIVAPDTDIAETQTGRSLSLAFEGEVTLFNVQHGDADVIHGQDANGDIQVTYEEPE